MSLVVNGNLPEADYLVDGFSQTYEHADFAMSCEEEVETESEAHFHIINHVGSDDGGGGDDEISLSSIGENGKEVVKYKLSHASLFDFHYFVSYQINLSKTQVDASSKELLRAYHPSLFLLYHNFKIDLPVLAA